MIKPLLKRVLIELDKVEKKTVGGIILPENAKNESMRDRGTVVAVGGSVSVVKSGDRVMFVKEWGSELIEDSKNMALVDCDSILAIVE